MSVQELFSRTVFELVCEISLRKPSVVISVSCTWIMSFVWVAFIHDKKLSHACLMRAWYTSLCICNAMLHIWPSMTLAMEPSAITPDSVQIRSLNPTSWKRFPTIVNMVEIGWNTPSLMMISLNFWWFYVTSSVFCVQGLVKDKGNFCQSQGLHNFQWLVEHFIHSRHLCRWGTECRQITYIVRDGQHLTSIQDVEVCPANYFNLNQCNMTNLTRTGTQKHTYLCQC